MARQTYKHRISSHTKPRYTQLRECGIVRCSTRQKQIIANPIKVHGPAKNAFTLYPRLPNQTNPSSHVMLGSINSLCS